MSRVLGTIDYRGRRFELTEDDEVWAIRMMFGEEGNTHPNPYEAARTIVGSMVRRLAQGGAWVSFTELVRGTDPAAGGRRKVGYSQPIRFDNHMDPRFVDKPIAEVNPEYRRAIRDMFTGRVALGSPGAVHFAAQAFTRAKLTDPSNPGYASAKAEGWQLLTTKAKNAVVSTKSSRSAPEVVVVGSGSSSGLVKAALVVGVLVVGAVAFKSGAFA
jgi:hypothetical protein